MMSIFASECWICNGTIGCAGRGVRRANKGSGRPPTRRRREARPDPCGRGWPRSRAWAGRCEGSVDARRHEPRQHTAAAGAVSSLDRRPWSTFYVGLTSRGRIGRWNAAQSVRAGCVCATSVPGSARWCIQIGAHGWGGSEGPLLSARSEVPDEQLLSCRLVGLGTRGQPLLLLFAQPSAGSSGTAAANLDSQGTLPPTEKRRSLQKPAACGVAACSGATRRAVTNKRARRAAGCQRERGARTSESCRAAAPCNGQCTVQ
jgi:hypothetical protein